MKALLLSICLVLCCVPAFGGKSVPLQSAKVISQEIGTYNGGAAVMPVGNMLLGVPINRRSNIVVLETMHHRLTLSENARDRHSLLLSVNDTVRFYSDGNWIVMLDSNHKKHKFAIIHMETLSSRN